MRKVYFLLFVLFHVRFVYAQNTIGIPNIVNYPKQTYHAGSQNFGIGQDGSGIMYFANNNGLMSFDGTFWRIYSLPNKTTVRSLAIDKNSRIYVGGQEEFGYFDAGKNGELIYTSLKNLIPKQDNDFADVWNICIFNNSIFFRSNKKLFELKNNKITVFKSINWGFLGCTQKELIAHNYEKGLVILINGNWMPVIKKDTLPANINVSATIDIGNDSILITSLADGAFILHNGQFSAFKTNAIKDISSKIIYSACLLNRDRIALATNLAGCIIINKKGELIQKISKQEGIQNNNILSTFLDRDNNLWLGLDNGIDFIAYNSAVKNIFPEIDDRNSGYASIIYHKQLYLGTSSGVYKTDLDSIKDLSFVKGNFNFIENTKGRVWNFSEVNGKLLVGQNKGAFTIENGMAKPLDIKTGFWTFQSLYDSNPSPVMIAGTYNGINFYNYSNGTFTNPSVHAQFESARFVAINNNIIWIAHPYKGLYKVIFINIKTPVATPYIDKNGILSANHNHLYKIKERLVLTTDKGIFEYDNHQNDFVPSSYYRNIFDSLHVSYLKEDQYGNIWFCIDKRLGIVDMTGKKPKIIYVPEMNDKIMAGGFENIDIIDSNNALIAAEKGFFHLNYAQYKNNRLALKVLIRTVKSPTLNNSLIYGGYLIDSTKNNMPIINYDGNSLHFEFSSTLYGQEQNIEYSYYLNGFDKDWSAWQNKTEKDYTNLPAGNYTFKVKCRNNSDNESRIAVYSFKILPPWYNTIWANFIYLGLFIGLIYLFYKRQQKKYKYQQLIKLKEQQNKYAEEQKRLEYLHELEIEKNEKQIIQLTNEKLSAEIEQKNLEDEQKHLQYLHQIEAEQNEKKIIALTNAKLQSEIDHKNTELASSAMNLVQKMELLSKLKEDLNRFKPKVDLEKDLKEFQKIIRVIDKELDHNQEWEQFAVHFDSVHTNYLKNIKTKYPDLTASELKLCAYLRLNLSTKEIAQLMNISIRGVETSRYRLRKKMGLSNEANLFDSLIERN